MSYSKQFYSKRGNSGRDNSHIPLPHRPPAPVAWIFGNKVRSPLSVSPGTRNPIVGGPFDHEFSSELGSSTEDTSNLHHGVYQSSQTSSSSNSTCSDSPTPYLPKQSPYPPDRRYRPIGTHQDYKHPYDRNHGNPPSRSLSTPPASTRDGDTDKEGDHSSGSGSLEASSPGMVRTINNAETRIVAPHVDKLSPASVVEICLAGSSEHVKVLCSVDVLKMQSSFFREVLMELECSGDLQSNGWRDPVVLPDEDPFEAASFLESLHEGRNLFNSDWSYAWTRLSSTWLILDLEREYARKIQQHIQGLFGVINDHHWRCNPNALAGMPVAVFRKTTSAAPLVLMGRVVEATNGPVTQGRIRVSFEHLDPADTNANGLGTQSAAGLPPARAPMSRSSTSLSLDTSFGLGHKAVPGGSAFTPLASPASYNHKSYDTSHVGDVAEPFWVKRDDEAWCNPDDLFAMQGYITTEDKRIFWEMIQSLVALPSLVHVVREDDGDCFDVETIVQFLTRPECRELWANGVECLPKACACTLLRAAFSSKASSSSSVLGDGSGED